MANTHKTAVTSGCHAGKGLWRGAEQAWHLSFGVLNYVLQFLTHQSTKGKTETQAEASINAAAKRDVLLVREEKCEEIRLLYTWKWNIFILPCNSCLAGR